MKLPNVLSDKDKFKPIKGIFWKKAYCADGNEVCVMMQAASIKVEKHCVPPELVAQSVKVLGIYDMWGYLTGLTETNSPTQKDFVYKVGKTIKGPIWGYDTFDKAQRKWVGQHGSAKDDRYIRLATEGGRKLL